MLTNISRSKVNQATKFAQLTEYIMRNIFLEKSYAKFGGEYLWINSLKFYAVCFYCMPSWGLYIEYIYIYLYLYIYMQSWKQCVLPVITTMTLRQLIQLGTWCTVMPKCMSYHKAIVVITGRAHWFHDCIHILCPYCFCEVWNFQGVLYY